MPAALLSHESAVPSLRQLSELPVPAAPPPSPQPADILSENTSYELRQALSPAANDTAIIYLREGTQVALTEPLFIDGFNASIVSDGTGSTIDGQGYTRIFHVRNGGRLFLRNIRLMNGRLPNQTDANVSAHGGAVLVEGAGSSLELYNSVISDCFARSANGNGGGVAAVSGASLDMVNCFVTSCECDGLGGGVYAEVCTTASL
eukprot:1303551-Pleurochrysis_carterae.AAC.1